MIHTKLLIYLTLFCFVFAEFRKFLYVYNTWGGLNAYFLLTIELQIVLPELINCRH